MTDTYVNPKTLIPELKPIVRSNWKILPGWASKPGGEIVHPHLHSIVPDMDHTEDWWKDGIVQTVTAVYVPEVRIEDNYLIRFLPNGQWEVIRISNGRKSAVEDPGKWTELAYRQIDRKDILAVVLTAQLLPHDPDDRWFRTLTDMKVETRSLS